MADSNTPWTDALDALPACWRQALETEFHSPAMLAVWSFLEAERNAGRTVYPDRALIFNALLRTPLSRVKAVIVGQDPYHGPGQAMGLSFSVPRGERLRPSLRNIFKELATDLGLPEPSSGDLTAWADRGVLLLNTSLTVEAGKPGSHAACGWQQFTDAVLRAVNNRPGHVAAVLWGNHARDKSPLIGKSRHLIHCSVHPSSLSARRGFFGSRPFSAVNGFLSGHGIAPIDWRLE